MAKQIDKTELDGATPAEAPNTVSNAATETVALKPSRKAKLKAGTASKPHDILPDYAALGVEETEVEKYERLRLRFKDIGRRSTAQVFECGEVVHELHKLAPDQMIFTKLAKGVLGLSRTGAENYGRVYLYLARYRARLVEASMVASALYDLATAEPEQVEEVLAAREAGRTLTGAQIKAMPGKTSAPAVAPDDGGIAGLKARIAEKTAVGVVSLMDNAAALLEALLVALEPHRQGKRIVVKDAQRPFIHPARLVREQMEWLTWSAVPAPSGFAEGAIHHQPLIRGDRFAQLHQTLADLGGFEDWPAANEVGPWLNDTVAPQLAWLLGDGAEKCFLVIDKMAAAAEAERVKAEQAKEHAKLELKKAREKAKREKAVTDKRAAREAKAAVKLAAVSSSLIGAGPAGLAAAADE